MSLAGVNLLILVLHLFAAVLIGRVTPGWLVVLQKNTRSALVQADSGGAAGGCNYLTGPTRLLLVLGQIKQRPDIHLHTSKSQIW